MRIFVERIIVIYIHIIRYKSDDKMVIKIIFILQPFHNVLWKNLVIHRHLLMFEIEHISIGYFWSYLECRSCSTNPYSHRRDCKSPTAST